MIDLAELVIPLDAQRALIVSDSDWGLEELEGLLVTLGGKSVDLDLDANHSSKTLKIQIRKIDPGTYIGKGKIDEIIRIIESQNLDLLLVDFDLSPTQMKNIQKMVKKLVLDRSGIILEIFNRHARTRESKLQVELARLEYFMPRLMGMWSHFERQRGSGGGALKGKGMGETQIEVDRRMVKDRMSVIRRKLNDVEKNRNLQRKNRDNILKIALVGYTNAGKSTLLNKLTSSDFLVEDALFATLDASVRLLNPKSRPIILAIDTVGFIDRLPHGLVASFRSTLGEVLEADLLIHVLDASEPEIQRHFDVTMAVLKELEATNIPMFLVLNKADKLKDNKEITLPQLKIWSTGVSREKGFEAPIIISANDSNQVDDLRSKIFKHFEKIMTTYEIVVPFEDGKSAAQIYEIGNVELKKVTEKGTFFRFKSMSEFVQKLNLERFKI